ncbi:MAG: hypothetical protein EOQ30_25525 [Mesorhizobium sp.]|nr:MAG: hypothetical protein EOQ30_25525 [Mesorhizobium sp.]
MHVAQILNFDEARLQQPARAVHRFTETPNCSNYLFLRNSGRKTVTHFSWNCSDRSDAPGSAAAKPASGRAR